ncbi:MAG: AAA family ATPase [Candidatus Brocadiaceae bacterium]
MPKLPGINHQRAVKAFEKAGFWITRQGKHITMHYIKRTIPDGILSRLKQDRVIVITGARQTGKTTLCDTLFRNLFGGIAGAGEKEN